MAAGQLQPTVTSVAAATSSTALFADGPAWARSVYNDSSAVLYLKFGTGASSTSHTVQVPPGGHYEFPSPIYRGAVEGAWSAATGSARCTELA